MNLQYMNILQSVMARIPKSDTIAPIMLMGDKGSGVSTLTCALGKYLSEENPIGMYTIVIYRESNLKENRHLMRYLCT